MSLILIAPNYGKRWRYLIVGLLLLQFFLRTHDILALPGYADESHHIRRAEVAWEFDQDPYASYHPGKLLLYYYLGLFETERVNALLVSRLAVALFTLLGGAALYAVGKKLFNPDAALMGLFMLAVLPFTVFIDRMALADPMTLALLLIAVWFVLLWRESPTRKMGLIGGLVLILPPLAKLTAMGVIALPFLAVLIFDRRRWRRYIPSMAVMMGLFALFWVPMFLPTLLGEARGEDDRIVLINDNLLNIHESEQGFVANLLDNTEEAISQTAQYYWPPALALTGVCWLFLLWRRQPIALWLAGLLGVAWSPAIVVGSFPSTRYLEIGVPFLILMLVGGLYEFARSTREIERQTTLERAFVVGFLVYGFVWGGGFYRQALANPADLAIPEMDRWRYVQSVTAGYGQREAVDWLATEGEIHPTSGQVEVYAILGSCHLMRLFMQDPGPLHLTCTPLEFGRILAPETLEKIRADVASVGESYLLIERDLASNFDDLPLDWTFERLFPRPHDGVLIELWRVGVHEGDDPSGLPPVPVN